MRRRGEKTLASRRHWLLQVVAATAGTNPTATTTTARGTQTGRRRTTKRSSCGSRARKARRVTCRSECKERQTAEEREHKVRPHTETSSLSATNASVARKCCSSQFSTASRVQAMELPGGNIITVGARISPDFLRFPTAELTRQVKIHAERSSNPCAG